MSRSATEYFRFEKTFGVSGDNQDRVNGNRFPGATERRFSLKIRGRIWRIEAS